MNVKVGMAMQIMILINYLYFNNPDRLLSRFPILLILFALPCGAQTDSLHMDSTFYFTARILNSVNGEPVQFAHIVNTNLGNASISDTLGYFYIRLAAGNEMQISAIGYSIIRFNVNDSLLELRSIPTIQLVPYIYPITSVSVNPLGNYDQFRERFLNLTPPRSKYVISSVVLNEIDLGVDTIRSLSPSPIGSPVTFFYNLWSREGRSSRKLTALLEEERFYRSIAHKYSPESVSMITGYKGIELYEFMEFCNFTRKFLLDASEYQIVEAILRKQREFK
jgi:hypothetical protein